MDLNDLSITLVLVNCVWLLAMRPARLWLMKVVAVLGLLGGTWLWRPDRAGYFAVGPWALLLMLPMWLQHWSTHLIQQRKLSLASWTSSLLAFLHPSAGARAMRQMIGVLRHLYCGEVSAGLDLARQKGLYDPGIRHLGMVIEAQMTGQWAAFEQQLETIPFDGLSDPSLLSGKLIAVAERGAWADFSLLCRLIGQSRFSPDQNAALFLRAFAWLGDVVAVRNLCLSSSQLIAFEAREFWTAVAEQVSGAGELARQRLTKLLSRSSLALRPMIEHRLATPAVGPADEGLRDRALSELRSVRQVIQHEARYAILSGGRQEWPVMTISLMLVMLAVFIQEIPGGSEDTQNLERLGAMVVPLTGEPGEWKHILTSGFLHFGPLHLALNLVGLLFLGRLMERAWGRAGMLILFLVCIVTSAALLPWLTFIPPDESAVFAGASGGIMGLLGGAWGHLFVGWLSQRTPLLRSQFRTACSVILLQCVCDLMTPQVSMTCHLIGLCTGIMCGIVVGMCGGRRCASRPV